MSRPLSAWETRTETCERLLALAFSARSVNPSAGREYALRAVLLADATDLPDKVSAEELRARARIHLGNLERILGNLDAAEQEFAAAESNLSGASGAEETEAFLCECRGALRHVQQDFPGAFRHLARALKLRRRQGDQSKVARVLHLAGLCLRYAGHPRPAAQLLEQALVGVESAEQLAGVLQGLASALTDAGEASLATDVLMFLGRPWLTESIGLMGRVRLSWLQARLAATTGALEGARTLLLEVRDFFSDAKLLRDAALATVDLALVEHLAGNALGRRRACLEAQTLLAGTGLAQEGFALRLIEGLGDVEGGAAALLGALACRAAREIRRPNGAPAE